MIDGWYVKTREGILGPITSAELRSFADKSVLPEDTLVRQGMAGKWRAIRDVAVVEMPGLVPDPSAAAAKILQGTNRSVGVGGSRGATPQRYSGTIAHIAELLLNWVSSAATGLLYPVFWIWRTLEPWKKPLTITCLLLVSFALPACPWLLLQTTRTPAQLYARLEPIWEQIQTDREQPNGPVSHDVLLQELASITLHVERRRSLTHPQSLYSLLCGYDNETAMALADIHRLATKDLPAAMTAGSSISLVRDQAIEQQLESVYGHLTSPINPYLPQPSAQAMRSRYRAQSSASSKVPTNQSLLTTTNAIVLVDAILVLAAIVYWRRSRSTS